MWSLVFASPLYRLSLGRARPHMLRVVPPDPWPGDAERGTALIAGVYCFAGQTMRADEPLWLPVGVSDSFLVALNGFEWLRDLRAVGGDTARRRARRLVAAWIDRCDRWHPLLWRPDVLGQRIANWLGAHDFFCASADDAFRARVFASLARQVRHLARTVPDDLNGAPLIQALKGLACGALALPGNEARLALALRLLERELPRQILPDGGHVTRNPAMQLTVLRDLIDICAALRTAQDPAAEPPEALQHAIDRMAPALRFFRHHDSGLALFNGSREGDPALIDIALALADAGGRPLKSARHCGYERVAAGRTLILTDVGGPPPAGFDAEAHAGPLSFELSVARERMIVNCGARPAGERDRGWADALRGTAAHSTVIVDDANAVPVIAGGGLGHRPGRTTVERVETDGAVLIEASHDFYNQPFGLVHRRRLYINADGDDLRGEDGLIPAGADAAPDRPFTVRFHLHPGVRVLLAQNGTAALIRLASGDAWRLRAAGGTLKLEESVYFGRGEDMRRTTQIAIFGRTGAGGGLVKWALKREGKDPAPAPQGSPPTEEPSPTEEPPPPVSSP